MIAALVIVPIAVGLLLYLVPRSSETAAKSIGVAVAFGSFIVALASANAPDESLRWLSRPFAASFHVGLGGIGFWIVLLLTLGTGCTLAVVRVPRARDFVVQMLVLQGAMTGVFVARDLLLFALFWDLMLLPVFLTLVAWSPTKTSGTAWKYLIYNLAGGLGLLLATAAYGVEQGTTDVLGAGAAPPAVISDAWSFWIFIGFAFAFLIKTPVWPLHTWMPDTYADLPAPMSAVVSAVQSKAGLYGFIVVGLALFPGPMHAAAPVMFVLGLVALFYGALEALVADDVKRVVAYSSLSHLGLILLAIFSFNPIAFGGAVVYILAHGLFNVGLFSVMGEVEGREDTRSLARLGGLGARNPKLAGALTIVALAALGLPGLCGFAGEILILTGLYAAGYLWAVVLALIPIVIAAAYMLRVLQGVMNGPEVEDLPEREDMTPLELFALAPLVVAIVLLGINPGPVLSSTGSARLSSANLAPVAASAPLSSTHLTPAAASASARLSPAHFAPAAPAAAAVPGRDVKVTAYHP